MSIKVLAGCLKASSVSLATDTVLQPPADMQHARVTGSVYVGRGEAGSLDLDAVSTKLFGIKDA